MTGITQQSTISRRKALRTGGASVAATLGAASRASRVLAQEATPTAGQGQDGLSEEITEALKGLPGQKGIMFWAPPDAGRPAWSVELNPDDRLFIASVFKGFALAECLRLEEESLEARSDTPLARQLAARLSQQLP
jgi:hypothetical protein